MMPPSQTECPGMLWPPPRTATGSSLRRANLTAADTSVADLQRAMNAGRRSMARFQGRRVRS
jgi:hypothetical protein